MRGAMFKPTALLVWGMFALAGVWGGSVCLAADGAPGDAPPAEAAPPVLPMPESTPDGWTDAQFAALKRLEIRLKHRDTLPSIFGKRIDVSFKVAAFDPLPVQGLDPLCIRQARLKTNFGEIKAETFARDKQKSAFFNNCLTSDYKICQINSPPIPEEIRIHSAVADIEPYYGAPTEAMLHNVDISALLRTVPLPDVELVSAKGKLPMATSEMILVDDEKLRKPYTKTPQNIMVHLEDVFSKPDEPGIIYYSLRVAHLPVDSYSFGKMIFQTNLGIYQDTERAASYRITHGIKDGVERIVINNMKVRDRNAKLRDALPMLVQNPFKPLPIVTDTGPVPPSPYGICGP